MGRQGRRPAIWLGLLAGLALSGCGDDEPATTSAPESVSAAAVEEEVSYQLDVTPEVQNGEWVTMTLTSNIPGEIEVMASVRLAGQEPQDIAVGTSQRVSMRNGQGEAVIQMSELPQGDYEVAATFYPRWGFGEGRKIDAIDERIDAKTHLVAISGSGEPAEAYIAREEGQKWVMNNVFPGTSQDPGMTWEPDSWKRRFGEWQEFPATLRNPDIIKNYYFPKLDMTITVNVLKDEIATWSMGKDGL